MIKPPVQKPKQTSYVKTAIRMPPSLHEALKEAAKQNDRSLNDEMLARLNTRPFEEMRRQNEELKMMLREVLTHLRS